MRKPKQLEFKGVDGRGGARKGAGRPRESKQVNHLKREKIDARTPMHITMRLKKNIASLRSKHLLKAFGKATQRARKIGLNVNQFSLQGNHFHMIVEAKNNKALGNGMSSLGGSFGKAIRKITGGMGGVFDGRYHLRALRTPTEYKNVLKYVLLNRSHHVNAAPKIDAYSSGGSFRWWDRLIGRELKADQPLDLPLARSWLGSVGWLRAA